jgi:hypothetical protein
MKRLSLLLLTLVITGIAPAYAQRIEKLPTPANTDSNTPPPVTAAPGIYDRETVKSLPESATPEIAGKAQSGTDKPAPKVLTLDAVLRSSARYAPKILEALDKARAAGSRALSAQGAFDLVFQAETYSYLSGFYDGQY